MQKKNSTANTERSRSESHAHLAAHLAAVLAHPLTPAALYNAIADEVSSMSEAIDTDAPEAIERILVAYQAREERRTAEGGAR